LKLSLYEHRQGVETAAGNRVVYDVAAGAAHFGAARVAGHALVWQVEDDGHDASGALLSAPVRLDAGTGWIIRCDRVDFPPGGIAYRHVHPGPGIRYLLVGGIAIETEGHTTTYAPGGAWFESGPDPVLARASAQLDTAFVRVMLLPAEWTGKRTIRYVDPADAELPRLQRATVFFDQPIRLPER
jgi:quercetin dioxygenase-like cupin family protein